MVGSGAASAVAAPPDPQSAVGIPLLHRTSCGADSQIRQPAKCVAGVLADWNHARALEGLGPITLPANFEHLSPAEQSLVLTNLERVDRGQPPVDGISSKLQRPARVASLGRRDPIAPSPNPASVTEWKASSNWAGYAMPLAAVYSLMYDDAIGFNLDCLTPTSPGCWGHRRAILGDYPGPLVMGAASTSHGSTQLFVGGDAYTPDVFTWSQELRHLRVGLSTQVVYLPRASGAVHVRVSASGMDMPVSMTTRAAGWTVTPQSCELVAGHSCFLTITRGPHAATTGSLVVHGPNGDRRIRLNAKAGPTAAVAPVPPTKVHVSVRGFVGKVSWQHARSAQTLYFRVRLTYARRPGYYGLSAHYTTAHHVSLTLTSHPGLVNVSVIAVTRSGVTSWWSAPSLVRW